VERVVPAVPHEQPGLTHVEQRRSPPLSPACGERHFLSTRSVVEKTCGRNVAAGARDLSGLAAHPERRGVSVVVAVEELPREGGFEEELLPQGCGLRIVREAVALVRPRRRERRRREALESRELRGRERGRPVALARAASAEDGDRER